MNSTKMQKDMTLKDELPRLVGVQYNTGKEQRNNSRRNEEVEPKQKQCPVWMCLVVKIKSDIVVLEKPVESPLDSKEIQPVNPKGNQSLISIGRIHAETEAPILWLSDVKSRLIRIDPDAGKD